MINRTVTFTEADVDMINRALGQDLLRTGKRQSFKRGVAILASKMARLIVEGEQDKKSTAG